MSNFKIEDCQIEGLKIVTPRIYQDERGYFLETYQEEEFIKAGISAHFVQDNQSRSVKGVLRGLHLQKKFPQDKLVRVIEGEIYDVAVDLRPGSESLGEYFATYLSSDNKKQLYIPKGFAHGFLVISDFAEVIYKCSEFYHPNDEAGIIWNDKDINIDWPLDKTGPAILSEKDLKLINMKEYRV